ETVISKRLILSLVQKIFDPIGILCAVTLPPKILLQDTWKLKVGWDIELPPDVSKKFFKWVNELYLLKEVCLPRFMPFNEDSELHVFVDASRVAYSACVFVRTVLEAETSVSLIRAKTRVAPLKPLTIPRLELMACCIGARLVNSIRDALNLPNIKVTFWSDSEVALWWIKEHGDWSIFVTNRVQEIRQLTQFQLWRHVPGVLNIADMLSRECSARRLLDSRWWEGPTWLKDAPENWPKGEICCEPLAAHTESKKSELVILNVDNDCLPWYCLKMSNYNRMINVFAYILRFVNNCQKNCTSINDSMLSFEEIDKAEKCLIKLLQCQFFKTVSDLKFISAFKDDNGILRVKTKITFRKDDESFLAPILLPELARSVLYECVKCKRFSSKPMSNEPTPLPSDRAWPTKTIYSDNGANIKGSCNELSKLDWNQIQREANLERMSWKFNPPTASWWGGWWERLVRVIKELLRRTLGNSVLSFEELVTVFCGCESVINSRPLTYISEESRELVPLTPSMFLIENRCSDVTDFEAIDQGHFQKRIRFRSKLLNDLKQRFRREYLGQLVQRKKDKNYVREPRLGEIVLVGDDTTRKRLLCPLAKIIELIPGKGGKERTVRVKTQKECMVRPIQRLFPLEIQSSDPQINMESGGGRDSSVSNPNLKTDTSSDAIVRKYTRSGRCIKTPEILDLLNCVSYRFEYLIDPQRGENVGQAIKQKSERELE
ncbi:hypothetical protein AVEN_27902-1, partial [Araneus ventricosus]